MKHDDLLGRDVLRPLVALHLALHLRHPVAVDAVEGHDSCERHTCLLVESSADSKRSNAKIRVVDEIRRSSHVRRRLRVRVEALSGGGPQATRRALARVGDARAIVLVEGISDQIALETLAARHGRNLEGESVSVVPIGGAQAIGRFLSRFVSEGSDATLAGLCDEGEEEVFRRSLERAGFGSHLTRVDMERLGFHVCVADLEDELIRALGPASVEAVLASQGDLGSFRTFQKQPAWRGQSIEAQLRRFMGSADRRKIRYARLLVDALDLAQVPRPLDRVLAHV